MKSAVLVSDFISVKKSLKPITETFPLNRKKARVQHLQFIYPLDLRMHRPVMVVEDDIDIRKNFIAALKLEDYPVYSAVNGVEALGQLEALETSALPGCIVIDLMMPEMNGKEFIRRLKEHENENIRSINLVVATAMGAADNPE